MGLILYFLNKNAVFCDLHAIDYDSEGLLRDVTIDYKFFFGDAALSPNPEVSWTVDLRRGKR